MSVSEERKAQALEAISGYIQPGIGAETSARLYTESGEDYEGHMAAVGYGGPKKLAEAVADLELNNKNIKILDVGAGSGLVAIELAKLGFTNIDAVDPASGLLEIAKERGLYGRLICQFVGIDRLSIDDDHYDMVVSCGAMHENHIPQEGLLDLIRVVKPGGYIVMVYREEGGQRPWYKDGLEPFMDQLEKEKAWALFSRTRFPGFVTGKDGLVLIYKKL